MKQGISLLLVFLLVCSSCDEDPGCTSMCDQLAQCGFLPSPLGSDRKNCVARCENSKPMRDSFNNCAQGEAPEWTEQAPDELNHPSGCSKIVSCAAGAVGASDVQGYGSVMLVPISNQMNDQGGNSGDDCAPAVTPQDAATFCAGWNVARATLILRDESPRVGQSGLGRSLARSTENSCIAALTDPPLLRHVAVGHLRAELVLQGQAESIGAAGAPSMGNGGTNPGEGGAAGAGPADLEPCVVFPAPTQINHAGSDCMRILLPFDTEISNAKACEREDQCSDNVDNDTDGWTDCEDPKCAAYCAHLMSVAPSAVGGAGPAESP